MSVAVRDEMKSRNLLRSTLFLADVWTKDVLDPVVAQTALTHPDDGALLPYAMVGTDGSGDGALDPSEIGTFVSISGQPDAWVAFFDVRGMRFHDGTPVEREDLLFSYHLKAMSPIRSDARFTKDLAGQTGTNYTATRWLSITTEPVSGWLGGPPAQGQFALKFVRTAPSAHFARDTMQAAIHPAYFWQGTGVRKANGTIVATGIHPDFGWALNPDPGAGPYLNGVPVSGLTTTQAVTFEGISIPAGTFLPAFDLSQASRWESLDTDVIGAGPMRFVTWQLGQLSQIAKNPDFFIPADIYRRETLLRIPALDVVTFRLYRNVQASLFALQSGDVHFVNSYLPPSYVPALETDAAIAVKRFDDAGFAYVGFNLRRMPFGYQDPAQGSDVPGNDVGGPFRRAVAYATDRDTIVSNLLQGLGVPGHTVVRPDDSVFYNASAPGFEFDLVAAAAVLDAAAADPVLGSLGYGSDPYGDCIVGGQGCRTLPGKGNQLIEILTPQADYDPIRAAAGSLIAQTLRTIGLNVVSRPTAYWQIFARVFELQDYDMYLLDWPIEGFVAPTYMESFFHRRNGGFGGANAIGYRNASLDAILDSAMAAEAVPEAAGKWKWAQGVVAAEALYDVLYFRTRIFAFRMDVIRPSSWVAHLGGEIWAYWSWIRLEPADPNAIRVTISAPGFVVSENPAAINVTVRDSAGGPLAGAAVSLSVTSGFGTISPTRGTSDSAGFFTATFFPPGLALNSPPVDTTIVGRASHMDVGASGAVQITIRTFSPGFEAPHLVPYSHPSGFAMPVPENWTRHEDEVFGNETVELILLGPISDLQTNILVDTDHNATIRETADYLEAVVDETIEAAQAGSPYLIEMIEGPIHRTLAGHAAVTFNLQYGTTSYLQKIAIIVSEQHLRFWTLVLTTDASWYPVMNETFEGMLEGFEITLAPPKSPNPVSDSSGPFPLLLAGALGAAGAAMLGAFLVFRRSRPRTASRPCPECGAPVRPMENACGRCGSAVPPEPR